MSEFIISACSTADLTKEQFEEFDIKYLCFHFNLDGTQYLDDLGESMSFEEFYSKMEQGAMTSTSQINVEEYYNFFKSFLDQGKDVIHFCLSSGISGTYNSACIARNDLAEEYPDRKIYVVDSLAASSGFGLLLERVSKMKKEGATIDEIRTWAEENKLKMHHWVFTTDLTYLIRGGRVSKVSGFVGSVLNICPIINVNVEGKLIPREKIRTKKKVIAQVVKKMEELAEGGLDYNQKCYISNAACIEDAKEVAKLIEEKFPKLDGKVVINDIGTTIGSHTGPGTVALFFWGQERVD